MASPSSRTCYNSVASKGDSSPNFPRQLDCILSGKEYECCVFFSLSAQLSVGT